MQFFLSEKKLQPFIKPFFFFITILILTQCKNSGLPPGDLDNGGLTLPGNFEAVVVADSLGGARHIAVSSNGDIYVKLRIFL